MNSNFYSESHFNRVWNHEIFTIHFVGGKIPPTFGNIQMNIWKRFHVCSMIPILEFFNLHPPG